MWLGIAFVVIAIVATVLQAWLWSFPMVPDPGGPDPNGKSTAPYSWTLFHRVLGLAFVAIYLVMMVEMVPRLWEYQMELPARTVMHSCMGIVIGVLLVAKVSIIRWFQHFGKALPTLGLSILTCTIILATLSVPFALQAHDFGSITDPKVQQRVRNKMVSLGYSESEADQLATTGSLRAGQQVLTNKCKQCHDMRKILNRTRPPKKWLSIVRGMAKLPTLGDVITEKDIPRVTAYLIAIGPEIVASKRAQSDSRPKAEKAPDVSPPEEENEAPEEPLNQEPAGPSLTAMTAQKELYDKHCTDCHETDTVEEYAEGLVRDPWKNVVIEMAELAKEEDNPISLEDQAKIIEYLNTRFPQEK